MTHVVRPCADDEIGAHSETNARSGHTKKMAAKHLVDRLVYERYDRGGAERRQRNKQGSMEEEANQGKPEKKKMVMTSMLMKIKYSRNNTRFIMFKID